MRRVRLLLTAALVVAVAVTANAAPPAWATAEGYKCSEPCASTNGRENYVAENRGWNESGKGLCTVIWQNAGGGQWYESADCSESATYLCYWHVEVWGHGQVRRWFAKYLYWLTGYQTNYFPSQC